MCLTMCIELFTLFGFLARRSATKHLFSLPKHMQVQLWEQRNVKKDDEPQEVVVRKGDVPCVGQLHTPYSVITSVRLGPVKA